MLPNPTPPTGFPWGLGCLGAAGASSSFGGKSSPLQSKFQKKKKKKKRKEGTDKKILKF